MKTNKIHLWHWALTLATCLAFLFSADLTPGVRAEPTACTPGPHGGTITADQTWCLADSPHLVTDWLTINPGVTVTIEAGSLIQSDLLITVKGSLVAVGTATQPITFTSMADSAPAQWRGMAFYGADAAGDLRYVTVRYAGWSNNLAIDFNHTGLISAKDLTLHTLRLEHSQLIDGNDASNFDEPFFRGLYLQNSNAIITDNRFANLGDAPTEFPIYLAGNILDVTMTGNTLENNSNNRIAIGKPTFVSTLPTLTRDMTMTAEYPWQMDNDFIVAQGATLTIEPGVTLYGGPNYELQTQGHLQAIGTPAKPILFRGLNGIDKDEWSGLTFAGGTGHLSYVTLQNGGGDYGWSANPLPVYYPQAIQVCWNPGLIIEGVTSGEVRIDHSTIQNNGNYWVWRTDCIMRIYNSHVVLEDNYFTNNGAPVQRDNWYMPENNFGIFAYGTSTTLTMAGNTFENNLGYHVYADGQFLLDGNVYRQQPDGIKFLPTASALVNNLVLTDIKNNALWLLHDTQLLNAQHFTIARSGKGVTVDTGSTLSLVNSILAENGAGVAVNGSGVAWLNNTLWDRNTVRSSGAGTLHDTQPFSGAAGFGADGYHLTKYSTALEKGALTGLDHDLDGELRPAPAGSLPDLGADEYTSQAVTALIAEKLAAALKAVLTVDPYSGDLSFKVQQDYLIRFFHGNEVPTPLNLTITDSLPSQLTFEGETHAPEMTFTADGNSLTWQTVSPVVVDQAAEVLLHTYGYPTPGEVLTNQAVLQAGAIQFNLQAQSVVPQYPPLITLPGNGEYCYADGTLQVEGYAWANSVVRLFENGVQITTAPSNAKGKFVFTYTTANPNQALALTTQVCSDGSFTQCSEQSAAVTITPAQSFFCPQRSTWSDMLNGQKVSYHFRNNSGAFSTQSWVINGYYGFWDTQLDVYACNCPANSGTTQPPSTIWVVADGVTYLPSGAHPWYHYDIAGGAHSVVLWAQCGLNKISSTGQILIDPDGFVFDSTLGFDAANPSAHAVPGATVTAYVWLPEWGGWVPWPAQLYDNQVNPQVTGSDGYFAFFTPPGKYYLQVSGKPGFQSWRSPVIEVVNDIVHVNVPLSPEAAASSRPACAAAASRQVLVTAYGPVEPVVTINAGDSVEWVYLADESNGNAQILKEIENPIVRLLSSLDPLANVLGFDSGMLIPNQVYRRTFTTPGTYTYSNGLGRTGTIIVQGAGKPTTLYLPLIKR